MTSPKAHKVPVLELENAFFFLIFIFTVWYHLHMESKNTKLVAMTKKKPTQRYREHTSVNQWEEGGEGQFRGLRSTKYLILLWSSWQTGTWGQESTKRRWRKEGCGGPKSLVERGCFIYGGMCLYIVIQGSFRQKNKVEQKHRNQMHNNSN